MKRSIVAMMAVAVAASLAAPTAAMAPEPQIPHEPSPRVVGGSEVSPVGKYPFAVALVVPGTPDFHFCGGSLIAPSWVLTAAHCVTNNSGVQNKFPSGVKAIIGRHDLTTTDGVRHDVTGIVIHPDWATVPNAANFHKDLALIQLSTPSVATPIGLATESESAMWDDALDSNEDQGTVLGWGFTATVGPASDTLQEVDLPFQSAAECIIDWGDSPFFYPAEDVCAGDTGLDTCIGDSGGPLIAPPGASGWKQVGIVSFGGAGCGIAHPIPVYTRVSAYLGWIASVTGLVVNNAPVGVPTTASTPNNLPVGITLMGTDSDGDALTFPIVSGPANGSLGAVTQIPPDSAAVEYTPTPGFVGVDTFVFGVDDGKDSAVGTVTITVEHPLHTVGLVDVDQGKWYLADEGGALARTFYYGNPFDLPIAGDWNGDGIATPGLFRQSDGFFYARDTNTQGPADNECFAGDPADIPLAGDWDGDGDDNLGLYRPSEQTFYFFTITCTGSPMGVAQISMGFGNPGDKPVSGDWDGDGRDEIGLHRESTGLFHWKNELVTGVADGQIIYGDPNDRFVAGDWGVVDGVDTPTLYRPTDLTFYFRHSLTPGNADSQFVWGGADAAWLPVSGAFGLE